MLNFDHCMSKKGNALATVTNFEVNGKIRKNKKRCFPTLIKRCRLSVSLRMKEEDSML